MDLSEHLWMHPDRRLGIIEDDRVSSHGDYPAIFVIFGIFRPSFEMI